MKAPRFKDAVSRTERDVAAMRARADYSASPERGPYRRDDVIGCSSKWNARCSVNAGIIRLVP
jgi:hypothetical protein